MTGLKQTVLGCATALAVAILSGCSGWESMDYQDNSEIPQGPGLFSGNKGGWTIFRVEEKKKKPAEEENTATKAE